VLTSTSLPPFNRRPGSFIPKRKFNDKRNGKVNTFKEKGYFLFVYQMGDTGEKKSFDGQTNPKPNFPILLFTLSPTPTRNFDRSQVLGKRAFSRHLLSLYGTNSIDSVKCKIFIRPEKERKRLGDGRQGIHSYLFHFLQRTFHHCKHMT